VNDSIFEALGRLPAADSDPKRAERVRSRCRFVLAGRRPARHCGPERGARRAWRPVVLGLGAAYLLGIVQEALHLYGAW
jgi:hypothetical protein